MNSEKWQLTIVDNADSRLSLKFIGDTVEI